MCVFIERCSAFMEIRMCNHLNHRLYRVNHEFLKLIFLQNWNFAIWPQRHGYIWSLSVHRARLRYEQRDFLFWTRCSIAVKKFGKFFRSRSLYTHREHSTSIYPRWLHPANVGSLLDRLGTCPRLRHSAPILEYLRSFHLSETNKETYFFSFPRFNFLYISAIL